MSGRHILCRLDEIPDGEARGFDWPRGEVKVKILVARKGDRVFGYRNSCPHVGVPLEMDPDDFMSLDGLHLMCSTHGAQFRKDDGYCLRGPCVGRSLAKVAVVIDDDGMVLLDD
ncbi:MAG: Rieske 2Fe-2S domain-containing protein [Alphaproteobacteria bacterium]